MSARRAALPIGLAVVVAAGLMTAGLRASPGLVDRGSTPLELALVLGFVAAAAYLVWTVPPAVTLTAGVVLSPLSGNWTLLGLPNKVTPDRFLLVAGVGVTLLRSAGTRPLPPLRPRPTHAVLALVLLYATISAAVVGTLFQRVGFFRLFDSFGVLPFLVFLVAPVAFATERSRGTLLTGLVCLGAYLGLTAVFEAARLNALVFPRFITAGSSGARAFGVFLEPVSNGTGMFVCGVAALIAFRTWRRPWARALAAVTVVVCAAGAFFVLERSVWLGVGAAAAVTVVAALVTGQARAWASSFATVGKLLLGAAVIAGIAVLLVPGLAGSVSRRTSDRQTIWDRQNLATAAENMAEARPLFGFGWSTFEHRSIGYFQQSPSFPLSARLVEVSSSTGTFSVHNRFLEYAATLGLVGTGLWLLGLLLAVGGALRARGSPEFERWRLALLPVLVFYVVISNAVPPALFPSLALWLWLGVTWAGYRGRPWPGASPALRAAADGR